MFSSPFALPFRNLARATRRRYEGRKKKKEGGACFKHRPSRRRSGFAFFRLVAFLFYPHRTSVFGRRRSCQVFLPPPLYFFVSSAAIVGRLLRSRGRRHTRSIVIEGGSKRSVIFANRYTTLLPCHCSRTNDDAMSSCSPNGR